MTESNPIYETFSPEKLSSYDYSEPYDENKKYEAHIADYGHGMRRYEFFTYEFKDNIKYAIAYYSPTQEELELIKPYCQCDSCSSPWWQRLLGIAPCACCFGCLNSPFASDENKDLAYKYLRNRSTLEQFKRVSGVGRWL